jgi:hypothetical protein
MKKILLRLTLMLVLVTVAWFAYTAYRARGNLVTLNVRDMEVRRVVKKIEWQTWESIFVHKDVQGKVTLNVRKMPLEDVLNIIDEQVESRWAAIYPLYSSGKSLAALKQSLRGEIDPATHGWTNLQSRSSFRGGGPPGGRGPGGGGAFGGGPFDGGGRGFGDVVRSQNQLVSLQIQDKDVHFATLALGRFVQARVVPEDGTSATVSLKFNQTSISDAVAQLARKARRSWAKFYTLRSERGRGGPGQFAGRDSNAEGGDRRRGDWANLTQEQREEMRKEREELAAELKETLPPEERERLEQMRQQFEQQRQEMQNMTPEQRRERFAQMGGANRDQRQLSRIKNTTPEQRVDRYRQMEQRRQRRPQQSPTR